MILFFLIYILSFCDSNSLTKSREEKDDITSHQHKFNRTDYYSIWDTLNIPEDILNSSTKLEEILEVLASRKYRSCKGSVLYHPLNKIFYFRNPSLSKSGRGKGSMKEYMSFKCRSFSSRLISNRQRFFIPFKDMENLLDNNEDSIFLEGVHELADLRKGMEMTLFPVKFYKSLLEFHYSPQKELLCYDSIKVLGIDKNNFDYLIISALDKHKILHCDSSDINKKYNLNNFIRYSSYCDEFCAEDFIYFSNDLIRCKCDFFSYVEDLKKNKNFITKNNDTDGCHYSRRLDRYEIFANPYEIAEKITKYEGQNKTYYRYYLHCIIILFTFQILYAFFFTSKNGFFIKFTIIFYVFLSIIIYISHRLWQSEFEFVKLFEVISDLYPVILLVFISCDVNSKQNDIIKMSYLIFMNSFDNILKEIHVNEFELIFRIILIIVSYVIGSTLESSANYLQFYNLNVRIKNVFELISRFFLYMAERGICADLSVPLFIILGRPREAQITSDHLLFQTNYLKLKPNFDKLYENWFMEALNFHKFKNMILFLKFIRYFIILFTLSFINVYMEIYKIFSNFFRLNFGKIFSIFIGLSFKNCINVNYGTVNFINKIHIPILISFLFTNVLQTYDNFKIFSVQFAIGFVFNIFSKENNSLKNKKNNQSNSNHSHFPNPNANQDNLQNGIN